MLKLLIIADDFTGALDTGVQFSKRGVPTLVMTESRLDFGRVGPDVSVLVADTESRHCGPDEAYRRVACLAGAAMAYGVRHYYKKTDSTLRGNIGAELAALLDVCKQECLSFIPAFPKSCRTTKNGVHYVNGTELNKTVFAQDLFEPVKYSAVEEIIHEQSAVLTHLVRRGRFTETNGLAQKHICIFDAETDEDLQLIGRHLKETGRISAIAGCAGFAEILPELLELRPEGVEWHNGDGPVLIVTGSVNQITIDQINCGARLGYHISTLSPRQKLDQRYPDSDDARAFIADLSGWLDKDGKLIINSVNDRAEIRITEQFARENNIPPDAMRGRIADNIAQIIAQILQNNKIGTLVVFGGDTLSAILKRLGCSGISPALEIAPGVVTARLILPAASLNLITKSGGLGTENVVGLIDEFIMKGRRKA